MSKESDLTKLTRARTLAEGLRKRVAAATTFTRNGATYTRDEVIAFVEAHEAAVLAKKHKYAEYLDAVAAERKQAKVARGWWLYMHRMLYNLFGAGQLAFFGMKPYGKPGPKTVAAKLAGVQKRAKKRGSK